MKHRSIFLSPPQSEQSDWTLFVDDQPFWIRGGEVHNSSSASADYMEAHVWPCVEGLQLNTLLLPVAWESVEPQPDQFDFSLPQALIDQARKRGMRLIFLWMGLWKNAQSTYVPEWVKRDTETYFRSVTKPKKHMYVSQCSISTFCDAAVERDAHAYTRLLQFLTEYDPQHTVIALQVENEVGLLGSERDYHPLATQAFLSPVPPEVAAAYAVSGSWEQAFGRDACAMFMSWCYASAVGRIAAAGKEVCSLPAYVNAWTIQYPGEHPGSYPAGGPVAEHLSMWKLCAPAIDWYSPDVYLPDFAGEIGKYQSLPLFVPECVCDVRAASYALYLLGYPHSLGVSPYSIENIGGGQHLVTGNPVQEGAAASSGHSAKAALCYGRTNQLIAALWPLVSLGRRTGDVWSFLEQGSSRRCVLSVGDYDCLITCREHEANAPLAAALILRTQPDVYLIAGMQCTLEWLAPTGENWLSEYIRLEEMDFSSGEVKAVRTLNGDDQWPSFGEELRLVRATLHKV